MCLSSCYVYVCQTASLISLHTACHSHSPPYQAIHTPDFYITALSQFCELHVTGVRSPIASLALLTHHVFLQASFCHNDLVYADAAVLESACGCILVGVNLQMNCKIIPVIGHIAVVLFWCDYMQTRSKLTTRNWGQSVNFFPDACN